MKLKTILHTGLTVSNLDKSVEFYQDVLGLDLIFRVDDRAPGWNNDYIGRLVGIPNAELREAWLALGDHVVELVEYLSPKGQSTSQTRPNDVGNVHVCFLVDDIEAAYKELSAKGVRFAGPPPKVAEGERAGVSGIYMWDPDGHNIELLYYPPGISIETYRRMWSEKQRLARDSES